MLGCLKIGLDGSFGLSGSLTWLSSGSNAGRHRAGFEAGGFGSLSSTKELFEACAALGQRNGNL